MNDDSALWLLAMGPAGATLLYWSLYRYYRNTDKSHVFEHETAVASQPVTGSDEKIDEVKGTRSTHIPDGNATAHRKRVQRVRGATGTR